MKDRLTLAYHGPRRPSRIGALLGAVSRGQVIVFFAVASWLAAALAVASLLRAAGFLARHAGF